MPISPHFYAISPIVYMRTILIYIKLNTFIKLMISEIINFLYPLSLL